MPLALELTLVILNFLLTIAGLFLGVKVLYKMQNINIQINKQGINVQSTTFNQVIKTVKNIPSPESFSQLELETIYKELQLKVLTIENTLKKQPKLHIGPDAPKDPKGGDIWFDIRD